MNRPSRLAANPAGRLRALRRPGRLHAKGARGGDDDRVAEWEWRGGVRRRFGRTAIANVAGLSQLPVLFQVYSVQYTIFRYFIIDIPSLDSILLMSSFQHISTLVSSSACCFCT